MFGYYSSFNGSLEADLKLLFGPQVHHFQRSICQFNDMSWFKCVCVSIVYIVGMEDTRSIAIENCLFAGGICEAEATPTVACISMCLYPLLL